MSRLFSKKQSGTLIGNLFGYKAMGFRLLLIKASYREGNVKLTYILEKDGYIEYINADVPENSSVPSVTAVFPEGARMQDEIEGAFPVSFTHQERDEDIVCEQEDVLTVEWGPFHPLLQEPVLFRFLTRNEIIDKVYIETGYNYRGVEALCIGEKIPYVLDMLERISAANGFAAGVAFLNAVEKINETAVPERAGFLRLILNEMSFLQANLNNLSHITKCFGLLPDNLAIYKLISLFNEAALLITDDPQFKGILVPGGISHDIPNDILLNVNIILQEMAGELTAIRNRWNSNRLIINKMNDTGRIDRSIAKVMTGRIARSAGFTEDIRRLSGLPYYKLSYKMPVTNDSNCFTRTMLLLDDSLLALSIIDQAVEIIPSGDIKTVNSAKNSGELIVREPDSSGELVLYASLDEGVVSDIKIRTSSSLRFSFLSELLKGTEVSDVPLVVSSLNIDFAGMEK